MSLNTKQKRFAREYAIDHNGAQAAIRAGYSEATAKQSGHRLLQNVAVRQLVSKLTAETSDELGIEAEQALAMALELWQVSIEQQPKIWKGKPVTWIDEAGKVQIVTEIRSPAGASKALDLIWKGAGLEAQRSTVEVTEVVHTLRLDRDLSGEDQ